MSTKKWHTTCFSITNFIGYLLAFIIPAFAFGLVFKLRGIYPFGDATFAFADMGQQYIPFARELVRKVLSGEGIDYSLRVGLGENFYGIVAYYLASPLQWISLFLPNSFLIEFMTYLAVFKICLASVSFYFYIGKKCDNAFLGIPFSIMYSLSAYMAAYSFNVMWLDAICLFPVLVWALERLILKGKGILYSVLLGYCIFTNYYISIMICIYLVIHFIMFFVEKSEWKSILNFVFFSILGAMLAGIILIPGLMAVVNAGAVETTVAGGIKQFFGPLSVISRHFFGVTVELQKDHWPNIYMGSFVFLLLPLYFFNKKLPLKARIVKLVVWCFFFLSFSNSFLDYFWHGFNYPNSLPARESFIYIFFVLCLCFEGLKNVNLVEIKDILKLYGGSALLMLICLCLVKNDKFPQNVAIWTLGIASIYLLLVVLYKKCKKQGLVLAALLFVVAAEAAGNLYLTGIYTVERASVINHADTVSELISKISSDNKQGNDLENEFFRVEKFNYNGKNDSLFAGYYSASAFASTVNSKVSAFYRMLGMRGSEVQYCFDGATPLTAALLNVKYMIGNSVDYDNQLFTRLSTLNGLSIYENNYAVDFAYLLPKGIAVENLIDYEKSGNKEKIGNKDNAGDVGNTAKNPLELQNELAKKLGASDDLFSKAYDVEEESLPMFLPKEDGLYYLVLKSSDTTKVAALGGRVNTRLYKNLELNSVCFLGDLTKEQKITLYNGDSADGRAALSGEIYRLNIDELIKVIANMKSGCVSRTHATGNGLVISTTLVSDGKLVLAIPPLKGINVIVNGVKTDYLTLGDALIALDLQAGDAEIKVEYNAPGKLAGALVSIVGIITLILIFAYNRFTNKKVFLENDVIKEP